MTIIHFIILYRHGILLKQNFVGEGKLIWSKKLSHDTTSLRNSCQTILRKWFLIVFEL